MNRKQRRAAIKQSPPSGGRLATPSGDPVSRLYAEAIRSQQNNELAEAARLYKRLLAIKPDHAEASNNLGCVLQAQGKLAEASARFARTLVLMPQLFSQFGDICATLANILPPIGAAMQRAVAAMPNFASAEQLLAPGGLAAIAADPMLLTILRSTPVREVALERVLTSLRAAALDVGTPVDEAMLGFYGALAKQCFINEYVFATTPAEDAKVERLQASIGEALRSGAAVAPASIAALAMYVALHRLPFAQPLADASWPAAVDDLVSQQIREPAEEMRLRAAIPSLTPIDDEVSQRVRRQYEENPYPRWVDVAAGADPVALEDELRATFPTAAIAGLGKTATEFLVAGCGTGWHAIATAQKYRDARVLAIDLSLSSLSYAKRKTPPALAERIAYAQADILNLDKIGRSFDVIDASGVLHHMADPLDAWRRLLTLLRPGGFMHLGFYSELGRRDVVAARATIAERGYTPTPADIRRCRQELLTTPLRSLARFTDFFSTSECRDLLFHVQESRMTIPVMQAFMAKHRLNFIGFEFSPPLMQKYRAAFANAGWSMTDLDRWHAVETQYPDTFSGMYTLWAQKA